MGQLTSWPGLQEDVGRASKWDVLAETGWAVTLAAELSLLSSAARVSKLASKTRPSETDADIFAHCCQHHLVHWQKHTVATPTTQRPTVCICVRISKEDGVERKHLHTWLTVSHWLRQLVSQTWSTIHEFSYLSIRGNKVSEAGYHNVMLLQ